MMRRLVERVVRRSLADAFRRVVLVGDRVDPEPGRPVVLYANHHYFHDGFLLWLVLRSIRRSSVTWMEAWDRAPLFAPIGARPFPPDDPARRAATVRATARLFARDPAVGLIYFPEGVLHPAPEGILPFEGSVPARLHRVLGEPRWRAAALHVAWGPEARPTALVALGPLQEAPDGTERDRLAALLADLVRTDPAAGHILMEGRQGPDERLPLHLTRRFFSRYL